MLVAGVCLLLLLVAVYGRVGTKEPPLDAEAIRRIRRRAEQILREERLPNE